MGDDSARGAASSVLLLFPLLQACDSDQTIGISEVILDPKATLRCGKEMWRCFKHPRPSFQTQMNVYLVLATVTLFCFFKLCALNQTLLQMIHEQPKIVYATNMS